MQASKEAVGSTGAEGGEPEAGQEGPGDGFEGTSLGSRRGHSSPPCAHPLGFSHPPASRCQVWQHLICAAALGPPTCSRTLQGVGLSPDLTGALSAPSGKGPEMLRPSISFVDGSPESFDGWGNRDGVRPAVSLLLRSRLGMLWAMGEPCQQVQGPGPLRSGKPPNLPSLRFWNIKPCSQ